MEVSSAFWIGFNLLVILLLALDLFVFHKKGEVVQVKKALWLSLFWISLALLFNVWVYFYFGKDVALDFFTAYLLEKSLSIDNLFVFLIIFSMFKISPEHQHGVLFWGVLGAIVFRAVFIFAGVALIEKFAWLMYLFGGFLIFTGIKMVVDHIRESDASENKNDNPDENAFVRILKKIIPTTDDSSGAGFFKKINGKWYATQFFIAMLVIEMTDVIFAIDSIPAVLSVTTDVFIVYTSNIFAILGLRSLYFALRGVMDYFHYLKFALSAILLFIGCKMILNHYAHVAGCNFSISNVVSLSIIGGLLIISIIASIVRKKALSKKQAG